MAWTQPKYIKQVFLMLWQVYFGYASRTKSAVDGEFRQKTC